MCAHGLCNAPPVTVTWQWHDVCMWSLQCPNSDSDTTVTWCVAQDLCNAPTVTGTCAYDLCSALIVTVTCAHMSLQCPNSDSDMCTHDLCNARTMSDVCTQSSLQCPNIDNDMSAHDLCNAPPVTCVHMISAMPQQWQWHVCTWSLQCPNSDNDMSAHDLCNAPTVTVTWQWHDSDMCARNLCNAPTVTVTCANAHDLLCNAPTVTTHPFCQGCSSQWPAGAKSENRFCPVMLCMMQLWQWFKISREKEKERDMKKVVPKFCCCCFFACFVLLYVFQTFAFLMY